ncbi:MAG: hypothetical protein O9972_38530 [Burkholderiales bacterium]|jgi:hypothetical protein|nr:hypothetical protein [Burkholderiales bacterium]
MDAARPSRFTRSTLSAPVRENLAVAQALGLEGRLGAWRGLSGRRYIVSTIPLDRLAECGPAVFIAVGRGETGHPQVAGIVIGQAIDAVNDPRFKSADAVDVHFLAESSAVRERVAADLAEPQTIDCSGFQ